MILEAADIVGDINIFKPFEEARDWTVLTFTFWSFGFSLSSQPHKVGERSGLCAVWTHARSNGWTTW